MMMPFFKELSGKKDKKQVTLQVQVPLVKCGLFVKRALSSASGLREKGSLTVEAAVALPLFLFFMVILMMPMELMNQERKVQTALEKAGEEVSQYAYVLDQLKLGEKLEEAGLEGVPDEFLEGLTEQGVLFYVKKRVEKNLDFKRLESVSFSRSSVLRDGEIIDLVMNYQVKLPFSTFGLDSVPMTARSCRRAWIGREGVKEEGDTEDELVYVGRSSTRYHRDRTCHYLYNDLKKISFQEAESVRNASGRKYLPCSRCGRFAQENGSVYIMPGGERYHSDAHCSSIAAYAEAVPLSEVRHLGGCSYCSQ
ncbi:MAG: hypothetical protein QM657_13820 [Lacrimispora sp.]|uniref:TadE/TadG family type IV pilus assembly protein n=1 Tax=Lacrimispora sp. TaxID=2719234 RepID=UPI0039E4AB59